MVRVAMDASVRWSALIVGVGLVMVAIAAFTPVGTAQFDPAVVVTVPAADRIFEVEGTLSAVTQDLDPQASGVQGTMTVNGFTFEVPNGVPVRVGAGPGEVVPFDGIVNAPPGFASLVGRSTVIATGVIVLADGSTIGGGVRFLADDVFLEEAENVLFGLVTQNDAAGLFVNGARIVMERDPRFEPFNRVTDLSGQPLALEALPAGSLATVEGAFKGSALHARLIEIDAIVPPGPGELDSVTIDRAEFRSARGELRVRGVGNDVTESVRLYEWVGGALGTALSPPIPIDDLDGSWRFRGTVPAGFAFSDSPPVIAAVSSGGGTATAIVSVD